MTQEGFKRKLTAILSADAVGYSRMMRDDEDSTIRTMTSYRSAISNLIQKFRGHVVDATGDNLLAQFTSVVDAVNSAVEIQRDLAGRNAELPDERKMEFRIGVNLGDVVEEEGRIYGDGVNIAARMESLAVAGGVCISGSVHDSVESKLGLEYEFLGEKEVKNNVMDVWFGTSKSIKKSLLDALELTQKALDIDEHNVEAYTIMCFACATQRKPDRAVEAGRIAIELNPNSDEAHAWLALPLIWTGKPVEAIELLKKAIRLCPFPPAYFYNYLGMAYRATDRCEEAIISYKKGIALGTKNLYVFLGLSICYGLLGQEEESRTAAARVLELKPNFSIKFMAKRWLYSNKELVERWNDILRKAGIPED